MKRRMAATATKGKLLYKVYRAFSYGLSPLLYLHLRWRVLRGLEHPLRWPERLGSPSHPRPPGPLLWFHAVSLGEGSEELSPYWCHISAAAMDNFISYWKPKVIMIMESELWPNLILGASQHGITMVLLNARMSPRSFKRWSAPVLLPLISFMLSKFSLILPLSNLQAIQFQLLQAPPLIISFAGDLKFAVEDGGMSEEEIKKVENLRAQLAERQVWMASSIHRGEEEVILEVHHMLLQAHPNLVTIIVPRHPQHGKEIAQAMQKEGQNVVLRSQGGNITSGANIYVVDTLGELRYLYGITPIAVVGGSFLPGLAGHNISEAAAAGCAVLTGPHIGHFSSMVVKMQQFNRMSVLQVHGKLDLEEALRNLFKDDKILEAHRMAAKQAQQALASGIVVGIWNSLNSNVLRSAFG